MDKVVDLATYEGKYYTLKSRWYTIFYHKYFCILNYIVKSKGLVPPCT